MKYSKKKQRREGEQRTKDRDRDEGEKKDIESMETNENTSRKDENQISERKKLF